MRRGFSKGLRYTIDLSKIADRANPRTVEAPSMEYATEPYTVDWGDGVTDEFDTSSAGYPAHTYAEGAGDVFTVVIRSATGHLPMIRFRAYSSSGADIYAVTKAAVSIDHFAGESIEYNINTGSRTFANCSNLRYIDTRVVCKADRLTFNQHLENCENLEQDIRTFCFDFCNVAAPFVALFNSCGKLFGTLPRRFFAGAISASNMASVFVGCVSITGALPDDVIDYSPGITSIRYMFYRCTGITAPFVFWNADGSLNADKYPALADATATDSRATQDVYANCSAALRAQVPTAYGGTMTVS